MTLGRTWPSIGVRISTPQASGELEIIKKDLHCNAVKINGSDIGRLATSSRMALEQGLEVWFSPTAWGTQDASLTLIMKAAGEAEKLSKEYPDKVVFVVGGEFTLFVDGIVKGRNFMERMASVAKNFGQQQGSGQQPVDPAGQIARLKAAEHNKLLERFMRAVVDSVRQVFHGRITYASLVWESVEWSLFDFVGLDHYRAARIKDRYAEMLKPAFETGKPVAITEVGVQTYHGAEINGAGLGGDIIDEKSRFIHYKLPLLGRLIRPKLTSGKHVRDESLQARELVDQLTILDSAGVYGVFVSTFVEQTKPYDDDPKHDLDMGSLSLVRYYEGGKRHGTTYPEVRWEPKESFKAVAQYYANH